MSSEPVYNQLDIIEHIRSKEAWAGSIDPIDMQMLLFSIDRTSTPSRLSAAVETILMSPALSQCVEEPIINALDQAQRCRATNEIRISFDAGRISIYNNGDGIPVTLQPGTDLLIPQFIFGVPLTGSNMSKEKTSTIGGTNGVGVKITNIHSEEFRVETYDAARRIYFSQVWRNGMRIRDEPEILQIEPKSKPPITGTRISFTLLYETFKTAIAVVERVIFTRAIWVAFYVHHRASGVRVYWNDRRIAFPAETIIDAIIGARQFKTRASTTYDVAQLTDATVIIAPGVKRYAMSIINGIVVPDGNHISFIVDQIKRAAKAEYAAKMRVKDTASLPNAASIANNIAVVILWRTSDVHWTSQSKDHARFRIDDLARALTLPAAFIDVIASRLSDAAVTRIDNTPARARVVKVDIDKYSPAKLAGGRHSADCRLFLAEGNSAKSQLCGGIGSELGFKLYGVLSLRGVILNARKEAIEITDHRGDIVGHRRSKKIIDSEFMNSFVSILGLDYTCAYTTASQRSALRYGGVIGCVDQDLDGVGNIFSLLLNVFHVFWPALITSGYVQRLATPIVRAFPPTGRGRAARVLEFYSEDEYNAWAAADSARHDKYTAKYYKGLSNHSAEEMRQIIRNMRTQMITYSCDDDARETFEIYLGRDPSLRRAVLSQPPPQRDSDIEQSALAQISPMPASYHLRCEAHTYQLDNLQRKLVHFIDGANQVSRKILDGCIKIFAKSHAKLKVADIAGKVSQLENYHHGEASLSAAIMRRAFIAPGGCQLPLLLLHGNAGTRLEGGQDMGAPRYSTAAINHYLVPLIYSEHDYPLLDFRMDEGNRGEPRSFMPIIPMCVLEHVELPAHGWNIRINALEVIDVISALRTLIASNGRSKPISPRPCCYPKGAESPAPPISAWEDDMTRVIYDPYSNGDHYMWRGRIIQTPSSIPPYRDTWSVGAYQWVSPNTVNITELPICVWTIPYIKTLERTASAIDSIIKRYEYEPITDGVNITITFNTDSPAYARLGITPPETVPSAVIPQLDDPVICALHLRDRMRDSLNIIMPDDSVRTFTSCDELIEQWFPIRRDFYARRIQRQMTLLTIREEYYANIIRYIELTRDSAINIAQLSDADAVSFLRENAFAEINGAALNSPELKFEPNPRAAAACGASFDYLLNLRDCDKTLEGADRFRAKISKIREEMETLRSNSAIGPGLPFVGARIWLNDLDTLERVIVHGRSTNWQFDDYGRFVFVASREVGRK